MNRINRKIITAILASTAVLIITGGAVTYGFQGVLASLGLLFLLASTGLGIVIMRKARLYAKALKYAEQVETMKVTPVSVDDKKWIMKHLDEYLAGEEEIPASDDRLISQKDGAEIMSHLDEFMKETWIKRNTVTLEDKIFIMENVELLFDNNREEGRQSFA